MGEVTPKITIQSIDCIISMTPNPQWGRFDIFLYASYVPHVLCTLSFTSKIIAWFTTFKFNKVHGKRRLNAKLLHTHVKNTKFSTAFSAAICVSPLDFTISFLAAVDFCSVSQRSSHKLYLPANYNLWSKWIEYSLSPDITGDIIWIRYL